jgi:hypothetical protein
MAQFGWWRLCLLLAGGFILAGGPLHPRGTMAEMLGHQDWVLSHLLVLAGFVAMAVALLLYQRQVVLPEVTARWTRWAIYGTVLQAVEMVLHTAAVVDHHALVAGQATPVLTAHLWLAVVAYPVFGALTIGWIVATARERTLASRWLAPLGIAGAAAHGLAAPLVVTFGVEQARILFPMVMLLALWLVVAALWPLGALRRADSRLAPAA